MEYLDTYDENGNFLKKEERSIVHRDALWHNTVHCWLYDKEGNIYFQIRKDKKKLYTTASGHVQAGESIDEAFGREIEEEIGYHVDYKQAKVVEVLKFVMDRKEEDGSLFRDRAFANVYVCLFEGDMTLFNFDEEELLGIVKINAEKALEILKKEEGSAIASKCYKEQGAIRIKEMEICFKDFLINPGETGTGKYGKILEFVINEIQAKKGKEECNK